MTTRETKSHMQQPRIIAGKIVRHVAWSITTIDDETGLVASHRIEWRPEAE